MASQHTVVKLGKPGFRGHRIEIDRLSHYARATHNQGLPFINSNCLPPPYIGSSGGGIAWDIITQRPYHSDGKTWYPIGGGAPGTVTSYSQIKEISQDIPTNIPTIISSWEIMSSPAYHTIPEWNLASGIYTAAGSETLSIQVDISWAGGVSNLGNRFLRIQFFDFGTASISTVKESQIQANPNLGVDTPQEIAIHVGMNAGDRVFVEVEHNAPIPLVVGDGDRTSISGFRVQTT